MAALDRLFDVGGAAVEPRRGAVGRSERSSRGVVPAPASAEDSSRAAAAKVGAALPLLPLPDVPRPEQTPARFLMTSERDGDCWDEHESWMGQRDRDVSLYGSVEDVRAGWTKEVA